MRLTLTVVSIFVSLFVAFMTHGQNLLANSLPVYDMSADEAFFDFDVGDMALHPEDSNFKVEGYWASSPDSSVDQYGGRFPFPKVHTEKWPSHNEFVRKLAQIEEAVRVDTFRGMASSRLEEGAFVGNSEFVDEEAKVIWPAGYREHYIEKFNVRPSREFYNYVMGFKSERLLSE